MNSINSITDNRRNYTIYDIDITPVDGIIILFKQIMTITVTTTVTTYN